MGHSASGLRSLRAAEKSAEKNLGHEHWRTAGVRVQLGAALCQSGERREGLELMGSGEQQLRESLGPAHPLVLEAMELLNSESR